MSRHDHTDRTALTAGRFGFDAPRTQPIERSIAWAGQHGFRYIDFQADVPPNDIASFDAARVRQVRALCDQHGVALGIHPSSAINNAEYVPIMAGAVDDYLTANLDLAVRLGCGWIIGHGGYHFGDLEARRGVAIARMKRLLEAAERNDITVYFENHNREPEHAEMHYLPHTVEETRWFFEAIDSPHFKWAFNVAHGNLVADGWEGFLAAFGAGNIGQVRLNDNNGDYEVHLVPGEGNIDFAALFGALRDAGYEGWFNLGFGGEADKIRVKDWFTGLL